MSSDTVILRDGKVIAIEALRRLWALEDRGVRFGLLDNGRVQASPASLLDESDKDFLHQHKRLLVHILSMEVRM